jgi:hypothetical protein
MPASAATIVAFRITPNMKPPGLDFSNLVEITHAHLPEKKIQHLRILFNDLAHRAPFTMAQLRVV